jgi:hypothetical protein
MKKNGLFLMICLLPLQAHAKEIFPFSNFVCAPEALKTLAQWQVADASRSDWKKEAANSPIQIYRTHGQALGEWVDLEILSNHETKLEHLFPDGKKEVVFYQKQNCDRAQWTVQTPPTKSSIENKSGLAKFTDQDLAKLLADQKNGILYIWSPNMSLSQKGVHDIAASAKDLGLNLTYLMDPVADEGYAREFIKKQNLPKEATRRVASLEIGGRGATLHYPSLMLYRDGKVCGTVQRGYRDEVQYRIIIEKIFGACK